MGELPSIISHSLGYGPGAKLLPQNATKLCNKTMQQNIMHSFALYLHYNKMQQNYATKSFAPGPKNCLDGPVQDMYARLVTFFKSQEVKGAIKNIKVSRLNLVDLAGSERHKDTQSDGLRLKVRVYEAKCVAFVLDIA